MGCRILYDEKNDQACLYCSTSDWAFGPVFDNRVGRDACERGEAFLRWLQSPECPWGRFEEHAPAVYSWYHDARQLTDVGLQDAYRAWLAQEADQQQREQQESEVSS